jgi:hypothetical protein
MPSDYLYPRQTAGLLIFIGCILAYRTRDLDPKFGEAKQLGKFVPVFR